MAVDAPRPDGLTAATTAAATTATERKDGRARDRAPARAPARAREDKPERDGRESAADRIRTLARPVGRALTRFRLLPWLLATALVLVGAGIAVVAYQLNKENSATQRDQAVLAAARQEALNFISIDYRNFDQDTKNVLSGATGDFKQQFSDQSKTLQSLVTTNKAISSGQVLQAGVVSSSDTSARVLIVADATVANTASPSGQVRNYRLQMDLVDQGGQWFTSDIQFVG